MQTASGFVVSLVSSLESDSEMWVDVQMIDEEVFPGGTGKGVGKQDWEEEEAQGQLEAKSCKGGL